VNIKKQILSYSSVNILNAAVPFLLLPILTKYLSPSDYGLLSLIQLLMLVSLPIVLMNTHGLLTIEYSRLSFKDFQALLSTIIWVPTIGFLFLEAIFFIFEPYIIEYFHIPTSFVYLIPFFVLLQAIPTIIPIIFQAKKEPFNFGKYKISMTILNVLLSLMFILYFMYGWEGRVYGIVGSFCVFTFVGFVILLKLDLLKLKFDKKMLRSALHFGLPLIPHSIVGIFLSMSDRIFLVNMLGEDSVGIYSVAFQISSAILIIMSSINQAWAPTLYEKLNKQPSFNEKINIVKTTYKIMASMILFTILFMLISPYIYDIFIDKRYYAAKDITIFISLAFLFQGFYFMVTNYIFYSKKTKILSYITISSVLLTLVSNYFLIQSFGILGSAYALVFIWLFQFMITFYISNKIYPMPWSLK